MNWLLIGVFILFLICIIHGYYKGFLKMVLSIVSMFLALVLTSLLSPYVSSFLQEYTPLESYVADAASGVLDSYLGGAGAESEAQLISDLNLPSSIKELLNLNNTAGSYAALAVNSFSGYIGSMLAGWVVNAIAYMLTFFIITIMLRLLMRILDLVDRLPVIHGINRIAGLLAGAVQALLIIWIGFVALTLFANTEVGKTAFEMINESEILTVLYNTNLLMKMIMNAIV